MTDLRDLASYDVDGAMVIAAVQGPSGNLGSYGDADRPVRTASLVKLLVALEVWTIPVSARTGRDRQLIDAMLRRSDDDACTELWDTYGEDSIVTAQVKALGLTGTAPPTTRGMWGWATMSARDLITALRHIESLLDGQQRTSFLAALAGAETRGADDFDQRFGLFRPGGRAVPVKQGWMTVDDRRYLHSVALLGDGSAAAVLTATRPGATWEDARALIDGITARVLAGAS